MAGIEESLYFRRLTTNSIAEIWKLDTQSGELRDLIPGENDLAAILQKLKNACGAGGTIDGDNIEVQGNHADRVKTELQKLGYRVR